MKYGAYIGWGVVIYAIMYLSLNGLTIYGYRGTNVLPIVELVILLVVTTIAARSLKFHSWKDILPYSICWMLVVAALDALYTVPFSGTQMYTNWQLWVGYALVVLLPLLAPLTHIIPQDEVHIS